MLKDLEVRLIFPINNISGQPIALGGRIIENLRLFSKIY